jgi:RNA recognition motif-containing protein
MKLESIKVEREKSAKRSLFVSGLKKDVFIKNIEESFLKFGKIEKIVIDQEKVNYFIIELEFNVFLKILLNFKNAYAIIEYADDESVDNALKYDDHKVNDHSVKVSRREVKEFISKTSHTNKKKIETLEKQKEEALNINKLLQKCQSVIVIETTKFSNHSNNHYLSI